MTEKLLQEFNRKMRSATLIPGPKGSFEVTVSGKLVFSKLEQGRFPDVKEIREALKAAMAGA